jgi:hypothetical protein
MAQARCEAGSPTAERVNRAFDTLR